MVAGRVAGCVAGAVEAGLDRAGGAVLLCATSWCRGADSTLVSATAVPVTTARTPAAASHHTARRRRPYRGPGTVPPGGRGWVGASGRPAGAAVTVGVPAGHGALACVGGLAREGSDGMGDENPWVIGAGSHPDAGWTFTSDSS